MVSSKLISEQGKHLISDSNYDFSVAYYELGLIKFYERKIQEKVMKCLILTKKLLVILFPLFLALALIVLYKNSKTEFCQKIRRNSEHFEVRKFKNKT